MNPPTYDYDPNFSVFVKSTNFKICDVIIDIAAKWELHFCLFFNRKYYQMKVSQILVFL